MCLAYVLIYVITPPPLPSLHSELAIYSREVEGGVRHDITNSTVTVFMEAVDHMIEVVSMPTNIFPGVSPKWTFNDEEQLPYKVEVEEDGFKLKFSFVFSSKRQEGNYTIRLGNFSASFKLETIRKHCS